MAKKKQKKAIAAQIEMSAQGPPGAAQPRKFNNPIHIYDWKNYCVRNPAHYYDLQTDDTGDVPVRLFFTRELLEEAEDALYPQIVNATRFPGVKLVVITPDAHFGYGVPVGSVILTGGTLAMGPVGYDIGCGMVSARSKVDAGAANAKKRLAFNRAVMQRVEMGAGGLSKTHLRKLSEPEFLNLIHGGAEYYISKYGITIDRSRAERNRIPVDDDWQVPWGGKGRPERGIPQLGSLGGGEMVAPRLQQCSRKQLVQIGEGWDANPEGRFKYPRREHRHLGILLG